MRTKHESDWPTSKWCSRESVDEKADGPRAPSVLVVGAVSVFALRAVMRVWFGCRSCGCVERRARLGASDNKYLPRIFDYLKYLPASGDALNVVSELSCYRCCVFVVTVMWAADGRTLKTAMDAWDVIVNDD